MAAVVKKHQQPADYAIQPPRKPQQRPPDLRQEPWLVYSHGKKNDKKSSQTFYSLSEPGRGYHVRGIPELRNQIICACSHGWLVLLDPVRRGCGLLNPVTMERIGLPDLPGEFVVTNCALSCSPEESGGCVVMFTERARGSFVYCRVGGKEEEEGRYWRREEVVDQGSCVCGEGGGGGEGFMWCHAMASLGGEFYVLTSCCQSLFKVEFVVEEEEEVRAGGSDDDDDQVDDESIRLVDLNLRRPEWTRTNHYIRSTIDPTWYLVQSSPTELMIVEVNYGDRTGEEDCLRDTGCTGMELYRADLESKFIEKVESLPEDCAIFLCHYGARSFFYKIIPTRGDDDDDERTGIRGNTIYFTKTIGDRYLYAYDVRERSVSVSLPCPNVKRFYDPPGWILPAASLSSYKEEATSSSSPSDEEENFPVRPSNLKYRCCYHKKFKHHQHGFPILIHKGQDAERLNLIDPTTTNSVGTLALPGSTLTGAVIRCSNHGWLLMTQGSFGGEIFFFNPFTKEKIVLPGLGIYEFEGITFSSPPTSSDCTVFGYSVSSHAVSVTFIRRGQRRWTDSMVERKTGVLRNSLSNPVYHQGKFYFMGTNGNLCIHDPKERDTKLMDLPKKPCGSVRRTYLLVSRGRLVAVFVGYMGRFVRVFELHRGAMAWKEVRDLGEVTLFLSSTSSLAVATRRSGGNGATARMGDQQVFLDKVVGGKRSGEEMLIYSLATKRFHTLSRGYESDDWCDTKEYTNSAWIEPNFETHTKEELRWFDPAVRVEETAACPRPKSDQWYKQCVAVE